MESVEGTVIEHRIDEVMAWSAEKNRAYKPRKIEQKGINKNLKHFKKE